MTHVSRVRCVTSAGGGGARWLPVALRSVQAARATAKVKVVRTCGGAQNPFRTCRCTCSPRAMLRCISFI